MTSFIWRDALVYGVFKIQQDSISTNQCIERNISSSHCNGGCVLTERLANPMDDSSKGEPKPIMVKLKIEYFMEENIPEIVSVVLPRINISSNLECAELSGFLSTQIKPPETV